MREEAKCVGCGRWFWFLVPIEEYAARVLEYVPAWCIDCGEVFEELDFEASSRVDEE